MKKNVGLRGNFLKQMEAMPAELNGKVEAASINYSAEDPMKWLVFEFSYTDIF